MGFCLISEPIWDMKFRLKMGLFHPSLSPGLSQELLSHGQSVLPSRLYQYSIESILYHPKATLLLVALFTLFFAWQIPDLKIRTSIYDLVVEDIPER